MAASKSPDQLKEEGRAIEARIADARKRPLSFAWLIGKDGLFLETDLKKDPDALWRMAKKNGGGPKGARGKISVAGKTITLLCDNDDIPTQLPRLARRFLSERGLVYEIALVTPGGPLPECEDTYPAKPNVDPLPGDAALRESLLRELSTLTDRLERAPQTRNEVAARKAGMLVALARSHIDNDLRKARAALSLIARKVDEAIGPGVASAAANGRRLGRLCRIEARIDSLLASIA